MATRRCFYFRHLPSDIRPDFSAAALVSPAIELGFVAQGFFRNFADIGRVLGGDDDDAAVGDGVAAAILVGVVADERAARDEDVAVDDGPADPGVPADPDAGHQ